MANDARAVTQMWREYNENRSNRDREWDEQRAAVLRELRECEAAGHVPPAVGDVVRVTRPNAAFYSACDRGWERTVYELISVGGRLVRPGASDGKAAVIKVAGYRIGSSERYQYEPHGETITVDIRGLERFEGIKWG